MQALRRLNLSPRALAIAGAAIVVFILWRRGQGGDGGSSIEGPLTTIPPGTGEEGLTSVSNVPQVIALPKEGGIIHIPGEDPIVVDPQPTPTPTPTPTKPTPAAPRWLRYFGRYWRPGQLNAFRAEWARRQRRARRPRTEAAWRNFLRQHPRVARFFGLPVPAAPAASRAAAAPNAQPAERVAAAAPLTVSLNTASAFAPIPGPGPNRPVGGRLSPGATPGINPAGSDPRTGQRVERQRRRRPRVGPTQPFKVRTISGAVVVMPGRALRGPRSPRRRPTSLRR